MQLGLIEDDPPSRSATTSPKRWTELFAEHRRGRSVPEAGPRVRMQNTPHQLCDDVLGRSDDIVIRCDPALAHDPSLEHIS